YYEVYAKKTWDERSWRSCPEYHTSKLPCCQSSSAWSHPFLQQLVRARARWGEQTRSVGKETDENLGKNKTRAVGLDQPAMVEPVGFVEAWKAQFPESEPPKMELNSVGSIELELERCKASIRLLEVEVNKERFRMIYLQTLLAKERKSYDRQRWGGFRRVSQTQTGDRDRGDPAQDQALGDWGKTRPAPVRKHSYHGESVEPPGGSEVHLHRDSGETDGASPSRQRGGVVPASSRRPPPDTDADPSLKDRPGMGLGVAALRSNFERIKRANSHSAGDGKQPYSTVDYHHERGGPVRSNANDCDRDRQAVPMERKRSLHSLPGNLAAAVAAATTSAATAATTTTTGEYHQLRRPVHRGRSAEIHLGLEEAEPTGQRFPRSNNNNANGGGCKPPPWQLSDFPPYSSLYGGVGEGVGGFGWSRRAYSPGSLEDGGSGGFGGGGGYTPDCSSNENLTSSEEDFSSSGQSSRVSPGVPSSAAAAMVTAYRSGGGGGGGGYRGEEKSRSPSQNSHQSLDSSSPPTPQGQRRHPPHHHHRGVPAQLAPGGNESRKSGHGWPGDGDRASRDNSYHGDLGK
ncbi:hypothetical protein JZ751_005771, partial [Albula glossodonta]